MPVLKLYHPDASGISEFPYMFYVSRKDDIIYQESHKHHCHEVLLRWGYLEFAKKGGGMKAEPYCFRPGHGYGYMSPHIQMALSCTKLAPTLFSPAVEAYIHPIEQEAGLEPTQVIKLEPHCVALMADRKWASNALAMAIWLQLIRTTMSWREKEGEWLSYLHTHSYFAQIPTIAKLKRVWVILPKLIAHPFPHWCGISGWTAYCGVRSQIYTATSCNLLGQWMWKNCWIKDE